MAKIYNVRAKVISQSGRCAMEHKVGDEFLITNKTPAGICFNAFAGMEPIIRTLKFGGVFPWLENPDIYPGVACTDPRNPVVFELRREEGEEFVVPRR